MNVCVIGLSDEQFPISLVSDRNSSTQALILTPNESDPLALRRGVYDAVESCPR
jgi:hypothetical protein